MKNEVIVELKLKKPWLPRRNWDKLHWGAKGRFMNFLSNSYRSQIEGLELEIPLINVTIDAYRTDWRELDRDNLTAGLKPYLDAMTVATKRNPRGMGLIFDDNPNVLIGLNVYQQQIPKADKERGNSVFVIRGRTK